jgi:ribosomal protein S18 acetylase RimI-like enzyme
VAGDDRVGRPYGDPFSLAPALSVAWPIVADDELFAGIHELVAAVVAAGGAVGWLSVPEEVDNRAWFDDLIAQARHHKVRVCVVSLESRVVGFGFWERFSYLVLSRNATVRKVMTHPEVRGRGVGRALLSALIEDARAAGVENLVLDVRGNNHGAMALYEAMGFEVTGRRPSFIADGDDRYDSVLYLRRLGVPQGVVQHGGRAEGVGAPERSFDGR